MGELRMGKIKEVKKKDFDYSLFVDAVALSVYAIVCMIFDMSFLEKMDKVLFGLLCIKNGIMIHFSGKVWFKVIKSWEKWKKDL